MLAARRASAFVQEVGLHQSHFKGNSEIGIRVLQNGDTLLPSFGHLVRDTLACVSFLSSFSFSHTVRQGNAVAPALAQRARLSFPLLVSLDGVCSTKC